MPIVSVNHPLTCVHLLTERSYADTLSVFACERQSGVGVPQTGERVAVFWVTVFKATFIQQFTESLLKVSDPSTIRQGYDMLIG